MARTAWRLGWALMSCGLVAACADGLPGRAGTAPDPLRPPGLAEGPASVDPQVVGDRLLAAGEADLALESYVRAATGPEGLTPGLRQSMARAHIAEGRLRQAESLLREVVALEPRNVGARNDLGVALLELGRAGEAHAMFRSAYALEPFPEIRENLRLSEAGLAATVGDVGSEDTFALTRRGDGTYDLSARPPEP